MIENKLIFDYFPRLDSSCTLLREASKHNPRAPCNTFVNAIKYFKDQLCFIMIYFRGGEVEMR